MLRFTRFPIFLSITLPIVFAVANAQTPPRDDRPRTASISGRVTVAGAPAANALVMVAEVDPQSRAVWPALSINEPQHRAFFKVRTNGDGRYRVTGLTEGVYLVSALSKAYTMPKNSSEFKAFRSITLDEGESRDDVDIALVRGGVITGRVIDAGGRPLVGADLQLLSLDENGNPEEKHDYRTLLTDDRGVYRIYGLPEGRYILSAGGKEAYGPVNRKSHHIFYPDVTDREQAKIIEVKEGAEVTGIDIRLGAAKNTYEATGRVIDAETGQALPQISVACTESPDNENRGTRYGRTRYGGVVNTDGEGKFRVTGLLSGRYRLEVYETAPMNHEHYSEKIWFEVTDSDVSGLELKAIRGSTITGVVVIEGASDPLVKAKLTRVAVGVRHAYSKIASDGGFRVIGISPGKVSFQIAGGQENAFSIKRIERDGAEITKAVEIRRGEQVTGIRIVVVQANGTIRGQVEIAGGNLPENWELDIRATPIGTTADDDGHPAYHSIDGWARADEKGRFVIESLASGEYELKLKPMVRVSRTLSRGVDDIYEISQRVTVNSGVETPVKLTLDLSRKQQGDRQ